MQHWLGGSGMQGVSIAHTCSHTLFFHTTHKGRIHTSHRRKSSHSRKHVSQSTGYLVCMNGTWSTCAGRLYLGADTLAECMTASLWSEMMCPEVTPDNKPTTPINGYVPFQHSPHEVKDIEIDTQQEHVRPCVLVHHS